MAENRQIDKAAVNFAALNPYVESNIVLPTECSVRGRDYVSWGENNDYPKYLLDLYNNVPTLRSIINGSIDYVCGDKVSLEKDFNVRGVNSKGQSITDIVRLLAQDYFIYGGFAIQVIRNAFGQVVELYHLAMGNLRTNKECNIFYYSEDWYNGYIRQDKVLKYPIFMREGQKEASVYFVKNNSLQVYPAPLYSASVKACEIEKSIDEYHLNEICNGFAPSVMINFNNGQPSDEVKDQIEKSVQQKFAGKTNAGRIMLSWNEGIANRTTIDQFNVQDYGAKYEALSAHSRQQIFTAFRANPNLFGIPTDNLGFSQEEYESAFKLYNRTQIQPIQRTICQSIDAILGGEGLVKITPFSLDGDKEKIVKSED